MRITAIFIVTLMLMSSAVRAAEESYVITIGPFSGRFEVTHDTQREVLTRIVSINTSQGPAERLSRKQAEDFLRKLRSFDWNVKPKKKEQKSSIGCEAPNTQRIVFQARVDDFCREVQGDGTLMPSLADFLDLVVAKAEESNQIPEPTSSGGAHR